MQAQSGDTEAKGCTWGSGEASGGQGRREGPAEVRSKWSLGEVRRGQQGPGRPVKGDQIGGDRGG